MNDLILDPAEFRRVLGHFPTGVTVIATSHEGVATGLAVGSFFSVSLDPPLVGFCVGRESTSWTTIAAAGHFVVNVLSEDQADVSGRFSKKGEEKFDGITWSAGPTHGSPRINGCLAHIDCSLEAVHSSGDHSVVIGRVHALDVSRSDAGPLLFYRSTYGRFAEL